MEADSTGELYVALFFLVAGYFAWVWLAAKVGFAWLWLAAKLIWILIDKQKSKSRQEDGAQSARQPLWQRRRTFSRTTELIGV